jgi:hypothetical protein
VRRNSSRATPSFRHDARNKGVNVGRRYGVKLQRRLTPRRRTRRTFGCVESSRERRSVISPRLRRFDPAPILFFRPRGLGLSARFDTVPSTSSFSKCRNTLGRTLAIACESMTLAHSRSNSPSTRLHRRDPKIGVASKRHATRSFFGHSLRSLLNRKLRGKALRRRGAIYNDAHPAGLRQPSCGAAEACINGRASVTCSLLKKD